MQGVAGASALSRRTFLTGAAALGAAIGSAFALGGCSGQSGSSSAASSGKTSAAGAGSFTVGTLATEDILPFWVAQQEGLFTDAGVDCQITVFQSATELIAGVSSGSVDMAMTDPMVAASLYASGTDVLLSWITLGATADQGRFGIMTPADSGITSLNQLAGVPIGVGSNTILEYVMDTLMDRAGVPADQVLVEELQKLPVRYQAMKSGQVKAAALPGSLLALGEAQGCVTIADDTKGDNISQSVMAVRRDYLEANGPVVDTLKGVWDAAVKLVNDDPEKYRETLVDNANLSDEVADTYPISTYPQVQVPTAAMVDPILNWMLGKGYLDAKLTYNPADGSFAKA